MLGAMRRLMEAKMKLIRWIIVLSVFSGQTYALAQDAKLVDAAKKEGGKGTAQHHGFASCRSYPDSA